MRYMSTIDNHSILKSDAVSKTSVSSIVSTTTETKATLISVSTNVCLTEAATSDTRQLSPKKQSLAERVSRTRRHRVSIPTGGILGNPSSATDSTSSSSTETDLDSEKVSKELEVSRKNNETPSQGLKAFQRHGDRSDSIAPSRTDGFSAGEQVALRPLVAPLSLPQDLTPRSRTLHEKRQALSRFKSASPSSTAPMRILPNTIMPINAADALATVRQQQAQRPMNQPPVRPIQNGETQIENLTSNLASQKEEVNRTESSGLKEIKSDSFVNQQHPVLVSSCIGEPIVVHRLRASTQVPVRSPPRDHFFPELASADALKRASKYYQLSMSAAQEPATGDHTTGAISESLKVSKNDVAAIDSVLAVTAPAPFIEPPNTHQAADLDVQSTRETSDKLISTSAPDTIIEPQNSHQAAHVDVQSTQETSGKLISTWKVLRQNVVTTSSASASIAAALGQQSRIVASPSYNATHHSHETGQSTAVASNMHSNWSNKTLTESAMLLVSAVTRVPTATEIGHDDCSDGLDHKFDDDCSEEKKEDEGVNVVYQLSHSSFRDRLKKVASTTGMTQGQTAFLHSTISEQSTQKNQSRDVEFQGGISGISPPRPERSFSPLPSRPSANGSTRVVETIENKSFDTTPPPPSDALEPRCPQPSLLRTNDLPASTTMDQLLSCANSETLEAPRWAPTVHSMIETPEKVSVASMKTRFGSGGTSSKSIQPMLPSYMGATEAFSRKITTKHQAELKAHETLRVHNKNMAASPIKYDGRGSNGLAVSPPLKVNIKSSSTTRDALGNRKPFPLVPLTGDNCHLYQKWTSPIPTGKRSKPPAAKNEGEGSVQVSVTNITSTCGNGIIETPAKMNVSDIKARFNSVDNGSGLNSAIGSTFHSGKRFGSPVPGSNRISSDKALSSRPNLIRTNSHTRISSTLDRSVESLASTRSRSTGRDSISCVALAPGVIRSFLTPEGSARVCHFLSTTASVDKHDIADKQNRPSGHSIDTERFKTNPRPRWNQSGVGDTRLKGTDREQRQDVTRSIVDISRSQASELPPPNAFRTSAAITKSPAPAQRWRGGVPIDIIGESNPQPIRNIRTKAPPTWLVEASARKKTASRDDLTPLASITNTTVFSDDSSTVNIEQVKPTHFSNEDELDATTATKLKDDKQKTSNCVIEEPEASAWTEDDLWQTECSIEQDKESELQESVSGVFVPQSWNASSVESPPTSPVSTSRAAFLPTFSRQSSLKGSCLLGDPDYNTEQKNDDIQENSLQPENVHLSTPSRRSLLPSFPKSLDIVTRTSATANDDSSCCLESNTSPRSPRARPWKKDLHRLSPQSWQRRRGSPFDNDEQYKQLLGELNPDAASSPTNAKGDRTKTQEKKSSQLPHSQSLVLLSQMAANSIHAIDYEQMMKAENSVEILVDDDVSHLSSITGGARADTMNDGAVLKSRNSIYDLSRVLRTRNIEKQKFGPVADENSFWEDGFGTQEAKTESLDKHRFDGMDDTLTINDSIHGSGERGGHLCVSTPMSNASGSSSVLKFWRTSRTETTALMEKNEHTGLFQPTRESPSVDRHDTSQHLPVTKSELDPFSMEAFAALSQTYSSHSSFDHKNVKLSLGAFDPFGDQSARNVGVDANQFAEKANTTRKKLSNKRESFSPPIFTPRVHEGDNDRSTIKSRKSVGNHHTTSNGITRLRSFDSADINSSHGVWSIGSSVGIQKR
jgi:hypothetical protein